MKLKQINGNYWKVVDFKGDNVYFGTRVECSVYREQNISSALLELRKKD